VRGYRHGGAIGRLILLVQESLISASAAASPGRRAATLQSLVNHFLNFRAGAITPYGM